MSETRYTKLTFEMVDTGIGQEMGYESDQAFLRATEAERAKLPNPMREALEDHQREITRKLFGFS